MWPEVSEGLRHELDSRARTVARSVDSKLDQRVTEEKTKNLPLRRLDREHSLEMHVSGFVRVFPLLKTVGSAEQHLDGIF